MKVLSTGSSNQPSVEYARHAADENIVAALAQRRPFGLGIGLAEVTAVADAAGERETGGRPA